MWLHRLSFCIQQLNYEITIGDKDQPIKCVCEKVGVSC